MKKEPEKQLKIEKYGSKILRKASSAVKNFDKKLEKLAKQMLKIMYSENGVGLAAPQIGINERLIVIDVDYASERDEEEKKKSTEPEYNPFIMVNPVIVYREGEMDSHEGCLSFPGVYFTVKRAKKIVFKFQDLNGKDVRMEAENDLFCRCIQHEIDHLDGKLFIDIASDKVEAIHALEENGFGDIKSPPPFILG
jgi:peptide deformylase